MELDLWVPTLNLALEYQGTNQTQIQPPTNDKHFNVANQSFSQR